MKHDDLPKSDLLSVSDFGPADAKASFLHPAAVCKEKRGNTIGFKSGALSLVQTYRSE